MRQTSRRILKRWALAFLIIILVAGAAFGWYASDYYHADETALAVASDPDGASDGVTVSVLEGGEVAFLPSHATRGLIFYPGGKVDPLAYAPLLTQVARGGIACVVVRFPANLAFLDIDAAARVPQELPDISEWSICGHSLGGVAAADYSSRHKGSLSAVIFLASYPARDLTSFEGKTLSVVGSADGVLNRKAYEEARALLPPQAEELEIKGANHAGFGNYGARQAIVWPHVAQQSSRPSPQSPSSIS